MNDLLVPSLIAIFSFFIRELLIQRTIARALRAETHVLNSWNNNELSEFDEETQDNIKEILNGNPIPPYGVKTENVHLFRAAIDKCYLFTDKIQNCAVLLFSIEAELDEYIKLFVSYTDLNNKVHIYKAL